MKFVSLMLNLVEYLLAIFIILEFNTPYAYSLNRSYYLTEIIIILILIYFFIVATKFKIKRSIMKRWLVVFTPYYVILLIYIFIKVKPEKIINFSTRFLLVIPILSLTFGIYNKKDEVFRILNKISKVIFCLSIISLFFWWYGSQLHLISPTGTINSYWGREFSYPSYYGLYFERQMDKFLWIDGFRNIGIFCEGPMFSLCLIFSLFTELFLHKDTNKKIIYKFNSNKYLIINENIFMRYIRIIVFIITLFTTTTITGIIIFIIMAIVKYLITSKKNNIRILIKLLISIVMFFLGIYIIYALFISKSQSNSWIIRMEDFSIGMKAWLQSPLFGNGYADWSSLENLMNNSIRTNTGFSNSIFTVLSQGGIVLFLVYVAPIMTCFMYGIKKNDKGILIFSMIFFIEFIVTLFQYTFLMMILLSFGYSFIITNKNIKCK